MINNSNFTNEHIQLCVTPKKLTTSSPLGHTEFSIITNCQNTEEVDQIAQKKIIEGKIISDFPKPFTNIISDLEISADKVTVGQGEYVVFHKLPTGEKHHLSRETFEYVYKVLLQHSPAFLINCGAERASENCANRYELLMTKLKEIDPTLEAFFVPKTLYELIFIRKCIQEDLKNKGICELLSPSIHKKAELCEDFLKEINEIKLQRKCWHLCCFRDAGDNEHVGVKDVTFRLNKAIFKAFNPSSEGFSHQEFSFFTEKEIDFLKGHHKHYCETSEAELIYSCNTPGPTTSFGFDVRRIKPMGIRNENDAQIIRKAVALDCSKIAQHSLLLYRGADFQIDSTSYCNNKNTPYSLSYGSSLFAGCLYDGGATAFYYMRNEKNAYAIPLFFDQINNSPFFVPTTHSVAQLFGLGEIFHARTKAWKDFDLEKIMGVDMGVNGHIRDHLKSDLNQEDLNAQFETYKSIAFQLK